MNLTTIKDVAKLSNLGTSTVSRYMNKSGFVSRESEEKILKACKELNYVPNALARAIKTKRTYTICLIVPTISNLFFPELAISIEQTCIKRGYKVILCNSNEDAELEKLYLDMIQQSYVDGVIVATGERMYKQLNTDKPIVFLDRVSMKSKKYSIVTSDHFDGGVQVGEYLLKLGCKRLLHIQPAKRYEPALLRKAGFEQAICDKDVAYSCVVFDKMSKKEKDIVFEQQYDGVFAWNDYAAAKFMEECRDRNISIPNDVQVIGYDDIAIAKFLYPKLTTISQPLNLLGKYAAEIVIEKIEGIRTDDVKIVLENKLVVRDTTKEVKDL